MTIDVEALLAESAPQDGQTCHTCRWVSSRPEPEQEKWHDALAQPKTWPATQVARAMAKVPQPKGAPNAPRARSVLNHRGGHVRGLNGGSKRKT